MNKNRDAAIMCRVSIITFVHVHRQPISVIQLVSISHNSLRHSHILQSHWLNLLVEWQKSGGHEDAQILC
ncbi:uncharacterized protein G2W53_013693 [Senna tora]|uniref:Uncharacterized protein n=1 Tax=Senna tora TaxID=362788 RepID=A0A834TZD2_9FABA|nr:uncharacterized protein G2W53_013693 [Senna tora]